VRSTVSSSDELALIAASTSARRSACDQRARALAEVVDWGQFLTSLTRQRLVALVAERIRSHGWAQPPAGFTLQADEVLAEARAIATANEFATLRVLDQLERSGIRALPLKGALLGRMLYGDAALRPSEDIDVLVALEDLSRASAALEELGYQAVHTDGRDQLHVVLAHPGMPTVEIHWRVHWHEQCFSVEMLKGASRNADGILRARPEHEYAALLLFWARDGFAGLRLAADIAQWWDIHGSDLDPLAIARIIDRHPALRRALVAAGWYADVVAGVPAGPQFGDSLARWRRHPPPVARIGNWSLAGGDEQIRANITLADLLMTPSGGRLAFVRRNIGQGDPTQPAVLHGARLGVRYGLAAWALRGGRFWTPLPSAASPSCSA
jgi:hypothetical protein